MGNCFDVLSRENVSRTNQNVSDSWRSSINNVVPSKPSTVSSLGILPHPRSEGEILAATNLKAFTFADLRNATKNFRPESLLGEGDLVVFIKDGLMSKLLPLPGQELASLLPSRSSNQKDFRVTRNGWQRSIILANFITQIL